MNDDLAQYGERMQAERKPGMSASNVGGCHRQSAYAYLGMPKTNEKSTHAADLGTLLHLGYSAMINAQYPDDTHSAPYPLYVEELDRTVECDHVAWDERVADDLKSAKSVIWQGWVNRGTPPDDYWNQVELYAFLLRRQHGGDWTLRITAFNRETGERAIFEREADPDVGAALLSQQVSRQEMLDAALVAQVAGADATELADGFVRAGKGPGTGFPCDYCEWLDACWPPTGPDDPRTPQSASVDGDTAAVAEALRQYDEGRALEAKGKRIKDEARPFLAGLTAGAYGDFTLGWGKPSGGGEVPDCAAMEAYFREKGMQVPMTTARTKAGPIQVNRRKT